MVDHAADWGLRVRRPELVERYRLEGWWTDQSLGDVVAGGLRAAAQCTFRVHSTVHPWSGTLGDVDRAARSLATTLQARGVGAGDTVMVQLPNWVEAAIAFWAAAYLGAVVVPVVHFYGAKEAAYILDVTRPKVVVTADRFRHSDYLTIYEGLLAERPGPLWLVAGGDAALPARASTFVSMLDAAPLTAPVAVDPDWPALVAFTSGTTSDPKGVVHSHRTIGFETRQLGERTPTAGPPPMTVAPVGHFIGMVGAFLGPLFSPRPVHLVDVFEPGAVLRLMLDEGITMSGGATYFLTSLLDHPDFSADHLALMPYVGLGGSVVPAAVTERAERLGITTFRAYGSSEHPSATGCSVGDSPAKRLHTDGRPLPGVDLRLDEDGQILTRGPDCCIGYTDPALTRLAFDEDGWYHTGDVGLLDDDGYLTITDRMSDIIIRGGENISAQEIEALLARMDTVAEVCVVSAPDARLGEHAAAIVRVRNAAVPPTIRVIREYLAAEGLARQKWTESLYLVDEFPRTPSGKVQKYRLRQQLRDGTLRPSLG